MQMTVLARTLANARERLLAERDERGVWRGELSSSALSTATASAALRLAGGDAGRVERGVRWLAAHANGDGGFGDTTDSPSNLSTTALAFMVLDGGAAKDRARGWLRGHIGELDAPHLARALEGVYGEDRTFAVPILFACAACGALGEDAGLWQFVPDLPFELAAVPRGLFRFLGLPVVSYALPALIAIGQAIERRRPAASPIVRQVRALTRGRTLRVLERIQPSGGGFLEATPLTSFVVMALASIGRAEHPVARKGLDFLARSQRDDGSWPIDTDLATWLTTLSFNGLACEVEALHTDVEDEDRERIREWLVGQQYRKRHPYTGAAPGGWAWTDLPGGVPDADDTAGALLALAKLDAGAKRAARRGCQWLLDLQNKDGGIPTFCRGWGRLPFDRSACDLTAHALRAWHAWAHVALSERARMRAVRFLVESQREDGAWVPLWFGNQQAPGQENPLYGTSRVLRAVHAGGESPAWRRACGHGLAWLLAAQHEDGGFGGAPGLEPTLEETALALEALCDAALATLGPDDLVSRIDAAVRWLVERTEEGTHFPASPIGLYFARLWYSERLYPLVFTVAALERARLVFGS